MPLFFIHGVNVRKEDKGYGKEVARRNKLFRDLVLKQLAQHGSPYEKIAVHDIYWGDLGVSFRWKLASLPKVDLLSFGPDEDADRSNLAVAEAIESLAVAADAATTSGTSMLKGAAMNDPIRFAESLLLPIVLSEFELSEESSAEEGELEALLARATLEVSKDPLVQAQIEAASSDVELIEALVSSIEKRFRSLLKTPDDDRPSSLESYGSDFLDELRPRIRELFGRALNVPFRAVSLPTLRMFRPKLHRKFSRFIGDVFVYLQQRGNKAEPGPIVDRVVSALKTVPKADPREPTIVVTHSMGGNILYDVLTTFSPDLFVDVWISVAGQVAQFEEMKLFLASNQSVAAPERVGGLEKNIGYWLNVYDPTDSFSFMADPVFKQVNADLPFSTGASAINSHGEYFGLASFHVLMREHIEKGLKLK